MSLDQNEWLVDTLKKQQKEREQATKEVQERELARVEANILQQKEDMVMDFAAKKKILQQQQDRPKEFIKHHQEEELLTMQFDLEAARRDLKDKLDKDVAAAEFEASRKLTRLVWSIFPPS